MLIRILNETLKNAILKTPVDRINEIRIRLNKKIIVTIDNKSYYLSQDGLSSKEERAIVCDSETIEFIIKRACENSVYAYTDQIKNGYITTKGGIRIGLAGEGVIDKNQIKNLKNISSLVIRIPKEVKGCSSEIMGYLTREEFMNTLIVSPPGCGKTTMIRDIIYQLSNKNYCYNVLLIDEKYEIANCFNGTPLLDVGNFCDVLSGVPKWYGFDVGIKNLKPDIIVTDEIGSEKDCDSIFRASTSGIKILASVHASNIEDVAKKEEFEKLIRNKVFKRFVILSSNNGPGSIVGVYDENMRYISY